MVVGSTETMATSSALVFDQLGLQSDAIAEINRILEEYRASQAAAAAATDDTSKAIEFTTKEISAAEKALADLLSELEKTEEGLLGRMREEQILRQRYQRYISS